MHISKLGRGRRINSVEDVVNVGDELEVIVTRVEEGGRRIALDPLWEDMSDDDIKELLAKAQEEPAAPRRDRERDRDRGRGDRDRGRGGRDRDRGRRGGPPRQREE
jgi:polyribonucleotide nucleotidyltransferase